MRHNKTENMVALLGGALLGATAMYLLDPEMGRRRRKYIAEQAGDYLGSAGEAVQSGWEKVSDRARNLGGTIAGKAQDYGQRLTEMAQDYGQRLADQARGVGADVGGRARDAASSMSDTAEGVRRRGGRLFGWLRGQAEDYSDAASGVAENVTDYGNRLWNQVRGLGRRITGRAQDLAEEARGSAEPSSGLLPVALTGVGCCAIGVGMMYLMDPQRGRSRRAWLADKTTSFVRRTGRTFYRSGQDLANRAYGTAVETRNMLRRGEQISSEQLLQRVRTEMGRAVSHPRLVQVMCDANGTVTLTGSVLASEAGRLISRVESVPGVNLVVNRLDTKNTEQEMSTGRNPAQQGVPQM